MLAQSLSLTFFPKGKTAGTGPGPLPYLRPHREGQVEIGESNSLTYRKYIAHIKPLERGGDTEGICKKKLQKGNAYGVSRFHMTVNCFHMTVNWSRLCNFRFSLISSLKYKRTIDLS